MPHLPSVPQSLREVYMCCLSDDERARADVLAFEDFIRFLQDIAGRIADEAEQCA